MMRYAIFCLLPLLAAADFPAPDKLPARKELPDPLVMLNGEKVKTAADWEKKRKPELKALFQHYMYGQLPAAPSKVTGKVLYEDPKAFGGKATLREVALTVHITEDEKAPKIYLLLVTPNSKQTSPVFIGMNFEGNHALVDDKKVRLPEAWMYPRKGVKDSKATDEGRGVAKDVWAIDQAIERGYAIATFYSGDVDPDRKEVRGGLKPFIDPDGKASTIAAWAWGYHRVVDYLQSVKEIDTKRICAVGHSRLGKTTLVAAAFDERIALAIPHQAGCGGTAPSRDSIRKESDKVETVVRINTSFPHWFNDNFKKFNEAPEKLPFDQHCLAALVAPRALLYTNAVEDGWANPQGQFEMLKGADPVYKLLKAGGLLSKDMPKQGVLSDGKLGYYIRAGKHSMTRDDWKMFLDYADTHLGKPVVQQEAGLRKRLLLIGQGPDGHAKNTHEYMAGQRVLAAMLKKVPGLDVSIVNADGKWTDGPELIDRVDGVVLFVSEGAKWVSADPKRLAALQRVHKRGGGLVTLHWAMGTREAEPIPSFVSLFGACHGGPDRKYKVLKDANVEIAEHEVTRGVKSFAVKEEEFYYALKLPKEDVKVTPLARVKIDGESHMVCWAAEAKKGRAFGFSGLHFHDNWGQSEYRRLMAQGVLWTIGEAISKDGLDVAIGEEVLKLR